MDSGADLLVVGTEQAYEQRLRAFTGERRSLHLRGDEPPYGESFGSLMRLFRRFLDGVLRSSLPLVMPTGYPCQTFPTSREEPRPMRQVEQPIPAPVAVGIGHVHLRVADLDRAVAFYRDVLGLTLNAYGPELGVPGA